MYKLKYSKLILIILIMIGCFIIIYIDFHRTLNEKDFNKIFLKNINKYEDIGDYFTDNNFICIIRPDESNRSNCGESFNYDNRKFFNLNLFQIYQDNENYVYFFMKDLKGNNSGIAYVYSKKGINENYSTKNKIKILNKNWGIYKY